MDVGGDQRNRAARIELQDRIVVETRPSGAPAAAEPEQYEFEVVGIVEESESETQYAVCYSERSDEFIVTDATGELLEDEALAQDILTDFLEQSDESAVAEEEPR